MDAKAPTLLLIDFQNDFFPGGAMALEGMGAAAENAARLLDRFRERGWPRFHVQHVATRAGAKFFLAGTRGVEIHESVLPLHDEPVVIKHFPNCFRETTLFDDLWGADAGELVICGAMSNLCIDAATRHAVDFGFRCTVIHDACAARALTFGSRTVPAADVHAACMAALNGAYARVCALEEWQPAKERVPLAA
jgi:nicotinamidase-related amidase